jgi:uncharacterized protein
MSGTRRPHPVSLRAARTALAACLAAATLPCSAQSEPLQDLTTFPRASLAIVHRDAAHGSHTYRFEVWVADTPARAEQGLMFVSDLPESSGMVFPLTPPRIERMWMKNTYIELDMLFVDAAGRISKITPHARPLTLDTLSSDTAVGAVIELRGGEAQKLSLAVGDLVSWKERAAAH